MNKRENICLECTQEGGPAVVEKEKILLFCATLYSSSIEFLKHILFVYV